MDKSPMFKAMFEIDLSEKHKQRIPLPGKKYTDFVNFLYTFYNPELVAPITEKNVLVAGSLADEYQIMDLKDKCESFILENCKRASENREICIDIETLLEYASYAENHNMPLALSLIIKLCSKHSNESLKKANLEAKVSADTHRKILDIRCSLMERKVATIQL
ncbi:kelch-like protein 23 [Saccostrea echinata]|uniref:kelch-like protein 23 n=1 Tax=Saccostrea echinata TaxID=191078 RepID=UPI002A81CD3A|nr:kelch-like protein 23 [Saccostrea echinata]